MQAISTANMGLDMKQPMADNKNPSAISLCTGIAASHPRQTGHQRQRTTDFRISAVLM